MDADHETPCRQILKDREAKVLVIGVMLVMLILVIVHLTAQGYWNSKVILPKLI